MTALIDVPDVLSSTTFGPSTWPVDPYPAWNLSEITDSEAPTTYLGWSGLDLSDLQPEEQDFVTVSAGTMPALQCSAGPRGGGW